MNFQTDYLTERRSYRAYAFFAGEYHEVFMGDVFQSGGINYVTVDAIHGEPFVGGDKWPVHTAHATFPLSEVILEECNCFLPEQSCSVCRASSPDPDRSTILPF